MANELKSPYNSTGNIIPDRFNTLDTLRGFAALSVVLWHWQHFFYQGTNNVGCDIPKQPLYTFFYLFYRKGFLAVDLFFSISGFIFFWLYLHSIANKKISYYKFFVLRISRLYPLHLATLIFVGIAQYISLYTTGSFIVYPLNDVYHFILNLLFLSSWGFQQGYSFNAPIWSVSVEMLLYNIFFFYSVCYRKLRIGTLKLNILVILVFILSENYINPEIYRGLISFFIGGTTFLVYKKIKDKNLKRSSLITGLLLAFLWLITLVEIRYEVYSTLLRKFPAFQQYAFLFNFIIKYYSAFILFPTTILFLSLFETLHRSIGVKTRVIGDISYSSYLLHFPLQLSLILICKLFNISNDIFYSKFSLITYFTILILFSKITYDYFERPCQNYIRKKLL